MTTATLAKALSLEYLLGVLVSIACAYAAFSAWQARSDVDLANLKEKSVMAAKDHDALIALTSDVKAIKETLARVERIMEKREAQLGN